MLSLYSESLGLQARTANGEHSAEEKESIKSQRTRCRPTWAGEQKREDSTAKDGNCERAGAPEYPTLESGASIVGNTHMEAEQKSEARNTGRQNDSQQALQQ